MLQNTQLYDKLSMIMVDPKVIEQIDPYRNYTVREIAKFGFIKNLANNPHDDKFVGRLIKRDELVAVNINKTGKRPVLQVSGQAIIDYLQSH